MRWLLALLILVFLTLHNLPYLIRDQAVIWLRSQGVENASITALNVHWLKGAVSLQGLNAEREGQLPLKLDRLWVQIDYAALSEQRVLIREVEIKGLHSGVAEKQDVLWLGPLNLTALGGNESAEPAAPDTSGDEPSPWQVGIDRITIDDFDWRAAVAGQSHHLQISHASVSDFHQWHQQQPTLVELDGSINRAPIKLETRLVPLPEHKRSELSIKVEAFPLQSVTALIQPELKALVDLDLTVKADLQEGQIRIAEKGEIRISDLQWAQAELALKQKQLVWNGDVALVLDNGTPQSLEVTGDLNSEQAHFTQAGQQVGLNTLALATEIRSADMQAFEIQLPQLDLQGVNLSKAGAELVTLTGLSLKDTQVDLPLQVNAARIDATGLKVMGGQRPFLKLRDSRISNLQFKDSSQLTIGAVRLADSETRITLDAEGQLRELDWLLSQLQPDADQNADEVKAAKEAETVDTESARLAVRLNQLQLSGNNHIRFRDLSAKPTFKTDVNIEAFTLGTVDTVRVQRTPFDLQATINKFAKLKADGEMELLGGQHNGHWTLDLNGLEMPPLSPYAERFTGYYLNSGQFNLSSSGSIDQGTIEGSNQMRINRLTVDQRDADLVAQFSEKITMPLETAIMVLEDNDNNITLDIPVTGSLEDPSFGYQSIINDLAARGLKKAAVGFLTKSLQPYATLISLASSAMEASEKGAFITLNPVTFQPGSNALNSDAQGYLGKLAEMLNERKAMRLNICGRSVPADRQTLQAALLEANKKRKKPLPPEALETELTEQLQQLAEQRAEEVKTRMAQSVDSGRLFLCFAQYDDKADAQARVELGL